MINTVKAQGESYLVNGTMSVPKADGNRDYEAVKKFIADGGIVEPEFTEAELAQRAEVNLIAHFKSLYLGVVQDKLAELDYDSLATVKLWEGDATFGVEASKILAWYKLIIAYNYALITAGDIPTDEEYLAGVPVYV